MGCCVSQPANGPDTKAPGPAQNGTFATVADAIPAVLITPNSAANTKAAKAVETVVASKGHARRLSKAMRKPLPFPGDRVVSLLSEMLTLANAARVYKRSCRQLTRRAYQMQVLFEELLEAGCPPPQDFCTAALEQLGDVREYLAQFSAPGWMYRMLAMPDDPAEFARLDDGIVEVARKLEGLPFVPQDLLAPLLTPVLPDTPVAGGGVQPGDSPYIPEDEVLYELMVEYGGAKGVVSSDVGESMRDKLYAELKDASLTKEAFYAELLEDAKVQELKQGRSGPEYIIRHLTLRTFWREHLHFEKVSWDHFWRVFPHALPGNLPSQIDPLVWSTASRRRFQDRLCRRTRGHGGALACERVVTPWELDFAFPPGMSILSAVTLLACSGASDSVDLSLDKSAARDGSWRSSTDLTPVGGRQSAEKGGAAIAATNDAVNAYYSNDNVAATPPPRLALVKSLSPTRAEVEALVAAEHQVPPQASLWGLLVGPHAVGGAQVIGRSDQVATIRRGIIAAGDAGLVTLVTGAQGVGKLSVAVAAARSLHLYDAHWSAVYSAHICGVTDEEGVARRIGHALGLLVPQRGRDAVYALLSELLITGAAPWGEPARNNNKNQAGSATASSGAASDNEKSGAGGLGLSTQGSSSSSSSLLPGGARPLYEMQASASAGVVAPASSASASQVDVDLKPSFSDGNPVQGAATAVGTGSPATGAVTAAEPGVSSPAADNAAPVATANNTPLADDHSQAGSTAGRSVAGDSIGRQRGPAPWVDRGRVGLVVHGLQGLSRDQLAIVRTVLVRVVREARGNLQVLACWPGSDMDGSCAAVTIGGVGGVAGADASSVGANGAAGQHDASGNHPADPPALSAESGGAPPMSGHTGTSSGAHAHPAPSSAAVHGGGGRGGTLAGMRAEWGAACASASISFLVHEVKPLSEDDATRLLLRSVPVDQGVSVTTSQARALVRGVCGTHATSVHCLGAAIGWGSITVERALALANSNNNASNSRTDGNPGGGGGIHPAGIDTSGGSGTANPWTVEVDTQAVAAATGMPSSSPPAPLASSLSFTAGDPGAAAPSAAAAVAAAADNRRKMRRVVRMCVDALDMDSRTCLDAISHLPGHFTQAEANVVAGCYSLPSRALALLRRLVARGLVREDALNGRFWLPSLVRQVTLEALLEQGYTHSSPQNSPRTGAGAGHTLSNHAHLASSDGLPPGGATPSVVAAQAQASVAASSSSAVTALGGAAMGAAALGHSQDGDLFGSSGSAARGRVILSQARPSDPHNAFFVDQVRCGTVTGVSCLIHRASVMYSCTSPLGALYLLDRCAHYIEMVLSWAELQQIPLTSCMFSDQAWWHLVTKGPEAPSEDGPWIIRQLGWSKAPSSKRGNRGADASNNPPAAVGTSSLGTAPGLSGPGGKDVNSAGGATSAAGAQGKDVGGALEEAGVDQPAPVESVDKTDDNAGRVSSESSLPVGNVIRQSSVTPPGGAGSLSKSWSSAHEPYAPPDAEDPRACALRISFFAQKATGLWSFLDLLYAGYLVLVARVDAGRLAEGASGMLRAAEEAGDPLAQAKASCALGWYRWCALTSGGAGSGGEGKPMSAAELSEGIAQVESLLRRGISLMEECGQGEWHLQRCRAINCLATLLVRKPGVALAAAKAPASASGAPNTPSPAAEAEELFFRVLDIMDSRAGGTNEEVLMARHGLGALLLHRQAFPEAAAVYRQLIKDQEAVLGPEDLQVAASWERLAGAYTGERRFTEAEEALQRCLALRRKRLPEYHAQVQRTLHALAQLAVTILDQADDEEEEEEKEEGEGEGEKRPQGGPANA
eukprot:jgi/Mesvir1/899/Mv17461-RA.1